MADRSSNEEPNPQIPQPRGIGRLAGFKAADVSATKAPVEELQKRLQERQEHKKELKRYSDEVRKLKRKNKRLKAKATSLSTQELCEIIGMKQHLAQQYEDKQKAAKGAAQAQTEENTDPE